MPNLIITGNKETILDNNLLLSSESIAGLDVFRVDPITNNIAINKNAAATATLDVVGGGAFTTTFAVNTNKLTVDSLGRVGIGATSSADLTINGDTYLNGSLSVVGTTFTGNVQNIDIVDANIIINRTGTDATANNAGITIARSTTNAQFIWDEARLNFRSGLTSNTTSIIKADGNTDLADIVIGTNDAYPFNIETNNSTRVSISVAGKTTFSGGLAVPNGDVLVQGVSVKSGRMPPGSIISFLPGTFGDGTNGTFTVRLGASNTIASVNAWLSATGYSQWKVCDGQTYTVSQSPLYNALGPGANLFNTFLFSEEGGAGVDVLFGGGSKYTPNLTDARFLAGFTTSAIVGGSNTFDHSHTVASALNTIDLSHSHTTATTAGLNAETVSLDTYGGNTGDTNVNATSSGHAVACHYHPVGTHTHGPGTLKTNYNIDGTTWYIRPGPSSFQQYVTQSGVLPFSQNIGHTCGINILGSSCTSPTTASGNALCSIASFHSHTMNHNHTISHSHAMPTAVNHNHSVVPHSHTFASCVIPSAQFSHTHGSFGVNTVTENRPKYMTNFYIVKII